VLLAILPRIIMDLHPKKTMRWDSSGLSFIRPLRWLVCLYDDELIPIELGHLRAGKKTYGHRFLEQEEVVLDGATSYVQSLADSTVIVDPGERQTMVLDALREQADRLGADYLIDNELLSRIVNSLLRTVPLHASWGFAMECPIKRELYALATNELYRPDCVILVSSLTGTARVRWQKK
jgi:glycyl-tRNA synthetase beta chain